MLAAALTRYVLTNGISGGKAESKDNQIDDDVGHLLVSANATRAIDVAFSPKSDAALMASLGLGCCASWASELSPAVQAKCARVLLQNPHVRKAELAKRIRWTLTP
jgi:hypothetical protein